MEQYPVGVLTGMCRAPPRLPGPGTRSWDLVLEGVRGHRKRLVHPACCSEVFGTAPLSVMRILFL